MKDVGVNNVLESEEIAPAQLPRSLFLASQVHLAGPTEKDYVVIATGELAGGNVTTFRIFRETAEGTKLVLTLPVHDLFIKATRSNGFKDIETAAMTAETISTLIYRFDGHRYQLKSQSVEKIN